MIFQKFHHSRKPWISSHTSMVKNTFLYIKRISASTLFSQCLKLCILSQHLSDSLLCSYWSDSLVCCDWSIWISALKASTPFVNSDVNSNYGADFTVSLWVRVRQLYIRKVTENHLYVFILFVIYYRHDLSQRNHSPKWQQ